MLRILARQISTKAKDSRILTIGLQVQYRTVQLMTSSKTHLGLGRSLSACGKRRARPECDLLGSKAENGRGEKDSGGSELHGVELFKMVSILKYDANKMSMVVTASGSPR
jgi:hypothetical protein